MFYLPVYHILKTLEGEKYTFERRIEVESAGELNPSRILFSQRHPSIAVPRHLLPLPLSGLTAWTEDETGNPAKLAPIPDSIDECLRDAIIPYLGTQKLNKNFFRRSLG